MKHIFRLTLLAGLLFSLLSCGNTTSSNSKVVAGRIVQVQSESVPSDNLKKPFSIPKIQYLFKTEDGQTYPMKDLGDDIRMNVDETYLATIDLEKGEASYAGSALAETAPNLEGTDTRKVLVANIRVKRGSTYRTNRCAEADSSSPRSFLNTYPIVNQAYNAVSNGKARWGVQVINIDFEDEINLLNCSMGSEYFNHILIRRTKERLILEGKLDSTGTKPAAQYVSIIYQLPDLGPDGAVNKWGDDCAMPNQVKNPSFEEGWVNWSKLGSSELSTVSPSPASSAQVAALKLGQNGDGIISSPIALAYPLLGSSGGTQLNFWTYFDYRVANAGDSVVVQTYIKHAGGETPVGPARTLNKTNFNSNDIFIERFNPRTFGTPASGQIVIKRISGTGEVYIREVTLVPLTDFYWAGVAMLDQPLTIIRSNSCDKTGVIQHELAHNFGELHSKHEPYPGHELGYGDLSCVMDQGNKLRQFNAPHAYSIKSAQGWISDEEKSEVASLRNGGKRFFIKPLYSANADPQVLKIVEVVGSGMASGSVTKFYLSMRSTDEKFASTMSTRPEYMTKVNIHSATGNMTGKFYMQSDVQKLLGNGEEATFLDYMKKPIKVKIISLSPDKAEVCVRMEEALDVDCSSLPMYEPEPSSITGGATGSTTAGTTGSTTAGTTGSTTAGTTGSTTAGTTGSTTAGTTGSTTAGATGSTTGGNSIRVNVASLAAQAVVSATSSSGAGYEPSRVQDGNLVWASFSGWRSAANASGPHRLDISFSRQSLINEIVVFGVRDDYMDSVPPTEKETGSRFANLDFKVFYQSPDGNWNLISSLIDNDKVVNRFSFPAVQASKIRVEVSKGVGGYARIVEVQAFSGENSGTTTGGTMGQVPRQNIALASAGSMATANSISSDAYAASKVIDGVKLWGTTGGWRSADQAKGPHTLDVHFVEESQINEIVVIGVRDNYQDTSEISENEISTLYMNSDFKVQYLSSNGSWVTLASVSNNNKVLNRFSFSSVSTKKIRVEITKGVGGYGRIVEVQAFTGGK